MEKWQGDETLERGVPEQKKLGDRLVGIDLLG